MNNIYEKFRKTLVSFLIFFNTLDKINFVTLKDNSFNFEFIGKVFKFCVKYVLL
jgi:hypothetical protein